LTKFLLNEGIHVNSRDFDGWSSLHAAACWIQPEILQILSRVHDADPFLKTRLDEKASDLAEDPQCRAILERMEAEKKNWFEKISGKNLGKMPRRSLRGSMRRSKNRDEPSMKKKDAFLEREQNDTLTGSPQTTSNRISEDDSQPSRSQPSSKSNGSATSSSSQHKKAKSKSSRNTLDTSSPNSHQNNENKNSSGCCAIT
jgi:hypothetical protein